MRLEDVGLCVQKKCIFMAPSVTYSEHRVDAQGLQAIQGSLESA